MRGCLLMQGAEMNCSGHKTLLSVAPSWSGAVLQSHLVGHPGSSFCDLASEQPSAVRWCRVAAAHASAYRRP